MPRRRVPKLQPAPAGMVSPHQIYAKLVSDLTSFRGSIQFTRKQIAPSVDSEEWSKTIRPYIRQKLSDPACRIVGETKLQHIRWQFLDCIETECCKENRIVDINNKIQEDTRFKGRINPAGARGVLETSQKVSVFNNESRYFACSQNTIPVQGKAQMQEFFKSHRGQGISVSSITILYKDAFDDFLSLKDIHILKQQKTNRRIAVYEKLPAKPSEKLKQAIRKIKTTPYPIKIEEVTWATTRNTTINTTRRIKRRPRRSLPKNKKKK